MAKRSVALNNLSERIHIIEGDLRKVQNELPQSSFDVVTSNPPYFKTPNKDEYNENEYFTIARHEVMCTLEDAVKAAKRYVKPGGKVAFVHRPERLVDMIMLFRQYNIEPKRISWSIRSETSAREHVIDRRDPRRQQRPCHFAAIIHIQR